MHCGIPSFYNPLAHFYSEPSISSSGSSSLANVGSVSAEKTPNPVVNSFLNIRAYSANLLSGAKTLAGAFLGACLSRPVEAVGADADSCADVQANAQGLFNILAHTDPNAILRQLFSCFHEASTSSICDSIKDDSIVYNELCRMRRSDVSNDLPCEFFLGDKNALFSEILSRGLSSCNETVKAAFMSRFGNEISAVEDFQSGVVGAVEGFAGNLSALANNFVYHLENNGTTSIASLNSTLFSPTTMAPHGFNTSGVVVADEAGNPHDYFIPLIVVSAVAAVALASHIPAVKNFGARCVNGIAGLFAGPPAQNDVAPLVVDPVVVDPALARNESIV